ncbi:hypothetical protein O181_044013 [Austropuccinia psidii MF-1]|uniref:Reverse transcriptase domain-containing protein n=1 Tax=Austropuccinia psidii MF-1 TaxID=1389203 RepID=A0A9Q3DPA1_9BASI|nr:hypothetical protein [Austropuccinia psidii MF-1]
MFWFLKQKDRLTALHPNMSETMVHQRILRRCGGDLEHAIRSRFIEPFSTEDYINSMEEITTKTKIGRNWYKPPIDNKTCGKPISRPNKPQEKSPIKFHKCRSKSHLANTCPKRTRINEIEIGKSEDKETYDISLHESDSEPSEEEELPDKLSIENINFSIEVTEVHNHLPQYSDECMDLIHVQDAKMQGTKPARGKGYTAGSSCITNIVINNKEAKIHLYSGAFCTCVGKNYLDKIYTNWKNQLIPIEGINLSSASQNMYPLGIIRKREITVIRQVKDVKKEKFVSDQLIEVQISPESTLEMKEELIEILFQYREAFSSDNEPLGAIKGHEVEIPYPRLLRRPAYSASPRAREELESHINNLMKLGVLRKVGHNEEVEVTTPVIITFHNDKSRMVVDFRAFNTNTIPDRYPIPRIHENLTQLSQARSITSMDALKGFHQNVLTPHARKLLRIISHLRVFGYLRMPFGIKNLPSHHQRMMSTIFPH